MYDVGKRLDFDNARGPYSQSPERELSNLAYKDKPIESLNVLIMIMYLIIVDMNDDSKQSNALLLSSSFDF
jgi:hypothetical protein